MRRLRVAVVAPEVHRRGGTERSLAEQMERWRSCFDVALYTMVVRDVDVSGVRVRRIWRPPLPHIARYLWWLAANRGLRWWDAWRGTAPDVVHSRGVNCLDATAMSVHVVFAEYWRRLWRDVRRDLFHSGRGLRTAHRMLFWWLVSVLERRVYAGPATIWALSSAEATTIERRFHRPSGSVPVVPHGVDCLMFSPSTRIALRAEARARLGIGEEKLLLLVSNDWHNKGVATALRALVVLPDSYHLAVAGRDAPVVFERLASELGVASRFHSWPHVPDVRPYYGAADCLVAPSRGDAFGQPVLEALASGLPVIVSAKAGVSELLQDGREALVIGDPEDYQALARLVRHALESPGVADRLGHDGRLLAERYTWDASAERAAALIEHETTTPRVLVLAPDPWGTGGIERATRTLVEGLSQLYDADRIGLVPVWGRTSERGDLPCRVLWTSPGRADPRAGGRVGMVRKLGSAFAALRAARRWRSRQLVIVACHPHLAPLARLCSVISGAPTIVWCHGFEVWGDVRRGVAHALRRIDVALAASRFTADRMIEATGVAADRVRVLPHALPPEVTGVVQRAPRHLQVLTVARLDPAHAYKGIDTLIRAWSSVSSAVPTARLAIVGDGADRSRLEGLAAATVGVIRFFGRASDDELNRLYAESTVFCLPGRAALDDQPLGEGFGLVFLEAAAAGLPVVAGRAGGAVEAVQHGVTGFLVDPESPADVAEALVGLLRDPGLATTMGSAAKEFVRRQFSFDRFRVNIADAIESVVQLKRAYQV